LASAKKEFVKILAGSYGGFGTDFIIRTALMLYGDVVKSDINKKIADTMKNDWSKFNMSLTVLEKLLKDMKIEVSHFASSGNVLLPIIYFNAEYGKHINAIRVYLLRAIFFTYFQSRDYR